jgi:uncharacterized protein YkwD
MIRCLSSSLVLALLGTAVLPFAGAEDKVATSKLEVSRDEQMLLDLLNKERAKEKLPALKPNPILFRVARAHSANMARQRKMEHDLDGKNPAQRILAAGYDYGRAAENIAMSEGPGVPMPKIVESWMNSKIHRENLLSDAVSETGLGIARNDKGEVYYTQLFARPRKVRKQED